MDSCMVFVNDVYIRQIENNCHRQRIKIVVDIGCQLEVFFGLPLIWSSFSSGLNFLSVVENAFCKSILENTQQFLV